MSTHATSFPHAAALRAASIAAIAFAAAFLPGLPAGPAPLCAQDEVEQAATMRQGRLLTQQFYDGEIAAIIEEFDEELRETVGGADGLRAFRGQVAAQLGDEVDVLDERTAISGEFMVYQRTARFTKFGGSVIVAWSFSEDGSVSGFVIRPAATHAAALQHEPGTPTIPG